MKRVFDIEFDVIKKVNNATFGFEINPADFLELLNEAKEVDCFNLVPTDDGIKVMIEDQEIAEMIIWECENECHIQKEEAYI